MKNRRMSHNVLFLAASVLLISFYGCGPSFQAGGDVAQGRQALFRGDYQVALGYFQRAEQMEPNYIYGTELREGVLSFLGRTQYLTGDLTGARRTLEQSLSRHKGNNLTRLYLGLTLARQDDRKRGLPQIETGMKGISQFLNYITTAFSNGFGQFWDPSQDIRKAIANNLAAIARGDFDWAALIANGESIGMKFEQEPDRAQQDEQQYQFQQSLD